MDNEFKDFTTTPTLTFDVAPDTKEAPAAPAASDLAEQVADPAFNEKNLRQSYNMASAHRRKWLTSLKQL